MSDGALSIAVAALQQIAQLGSQERDRVTARAALDCIDALGEGRGVPSANKAAPADTGAAAKRAAEWLAMTHSHICPYCATTANLARDVVALTDELERVAGPGGRARTGGVMGELLHFADCDGADPCSCDNVVEMLPTWPMVRCDGCRKTYRINDATGVIVGDCPYCGGERFSTSMMPFGVIDGE